MFSSPRVIAALYFILSVIAVVVPHLGTSLFGVDLPNHATRLWIECQAAGAPSERIWSIKYELIPNLAIDVLNMPLCGVLEPEASVSGIVAGTTSAILLLIWFLARNLPGGDKPLILLAPGMTFNLVTFMGYVNYWIGVALFLLFVLLLMIFKRDRSTPNDRAIFQIVIANLFGVALFFSHLFALGLAMMFLLGLKWSDFAGHRPVRRLVQSAIFTGAAFTCALVLILLAPRSGTGFGYSLVGKLRALWAPLLYAQVYVTALLVFLTFAVLLWSFRERLISISPRLRPSFLMIGLFCVAVPSSLYNAVDLDSRSFVALTMLTVTALGISADDSRARSLWLATAVVGSMSVGLQSFATIHSHRILDRQVAEFRSATGIVPGGASVFSVQADEETPILGNLYSHFASYGSRDQGWFNPLEFSGKGMQPLRSTATYSCIDVPASTPLSPNVARQLTQPDVVPLLEDPVNASIRFAYLWPRRFDYVIFYHFGGAPNFAPRLLRLVHNGSFFSILRVVGSETRARDSSCSGPNQSGAWHRLSAIDAHS